MSFTTEQRAALISHIHKDDLLALDIILALIGSGSLLQEGVDHLESRIGQLLQLFGTLDVRGRLTD